MEAKFALSEKPSAGFQSGIPGSEEGYRAVFAALDTPVFVADAVTGMLIDANRKAEELVGIPVDELRQMHHMDLHPEGERERVQKIFCSLVSSGGGTAVVPVATRNGDILSIEVISSIARLGGKTVMMGIFQDATRKERIEKALIEAHQSLESAIQERTDSFLAQLHIQKREMEARYSSFLETTHGIAFRSRMDLVPVLFFGGVEALTGHSQDDFIDGKVRLEQVLDPGDMDRIRDFVEEIRKAPGRSMDTECRVVRKDGEHRWVHVVARSLFDREGQAVGIEGTAVDITDRKSIEALLQDSEEKYRALADNLNIGVYRTTVDPRGRFLHANTAFARIFGYDSHREIVGKVVSSLYCNPDDRKDFIRDILEKGVSKGRELLLKKKDGTSIWCSSTGIAARDFNGNIQWVDGIIEDITERKEVEKTLRESETRYRTVFESTGTAMLVIEEDTTISLVNGEYEKLTGYTKEETEGIRSWRNSLAPEQLRRAEGYHKLRRRKPGSAPRKYETRIVDRFGNEKDIFITVDMIPGTGKSIASIVDITPQKKRERDLRASEERFRVFFEAVKDFIFIKDRELRYVQVNPAMTGILGVPASQLIGKTDEAIFGEKAGRYTRKIDARVLAGEVVEDEFTQPLRGRSYSFHVIKVPLRDGLDNIIGICGIYRDITERKKFEAELIKQARELEDYNAALRILLKNRDQERAEVERKILSNIHELVFPYLDKIKRHPDSPTSSQYIDIIEKTLEEITSSFAHHLISKQLSMTSREIQIANLIREGKTTKDIAKVLNLSLKTIEFYRNSIRAKLGLKNRKSHLRSHLLGLS
jgi:PAS domain S-box-containing protein